MVLYINHRQQHSQIVPVSQCPYTRVDIFGMQAVVFQTEEESACCSAEDVVSRYIAVLPGKRAYIIENGIALLTGGDENGRGRGAGGECLRFGLLDLRGRGGGADGWGWNIGPSIDGLHNGSKVCVVTKLVVHG